jgi:hypothetical protein
MFSMRSHRVATLVSLAAFALTAATQPLHAQGALPSAMSLLEKHDAAVGGRAALDKHSSIHATVALTIAAANLTGTMDEYHAKPNLYFTKQVFVGQEVSSGFDGKVAWGIAPGQGPMLLDSATTAGIKVQSDFFADYYDPSKVKSAETIGVETFEGQRCYKVKLVHHDNSEKIIYLDSATGLRAGQSETTTVNGQSMARTIVMSDYKDFGGVKVPMKRVIRLPMAEVVGQITSMEFDTVDPSTFALPDAVKALIKP